MTKWEFISRLGTLAALALSFYNFYLQRRDKKPRLKVEANLGVKEIEIVNDGFGGHSLRRDYCMVLTLRNPTDREIMVHEISFVSRQATKLKTWDRIPTVPSHKAAEVIIPNSNLPFEKATGYFQVKDILGNKSFSKKQFYDLTNPRNYFSSEEDFQKFVKDRNDEKEAFERED